MTSSISLFPSPAERYVVLLELARTVSSSFVPADLCRAIHAHVTRVVPATSFTVALAAPDGALFPELHTGAGAGTIELRDAERDHLRAGDFVLRTVGPWVELLAPLVAQERLVGCLRAAKGADQAFDAADAHFLLAVGAVCGAAVENARLFGELKSGRKEAELLESVARELSRSLELVDVAGRIVDRVAEVAGAPAALWLAEGELARIVAATAGAGAPGEERPLSEAVAAQLVAGSAAAEGAPVLAAPVAGFGDPGTFLLPLVSGGRLVAVLALLHGGAPLPPAERMRLLGRISLHALSAVQNAVLHEEVRRLSLTDPLVDLPNRRQLDLFLEKEFAAAQRGRPLCFALFDLDHFKEYNDAWGHQGGDQALIRFAGVLRAETRAMNLAGRYGGEEFATVLADTSRAGAHAYAQRVRRRMSLELKGALTVSAGVAAYAEPMAGVADLVAAADRALYRAKMEGRNRVCLADMS